MSDHRSSWLRCSIVILLLLLYEVGLTLYQVPLRGGASALCIESIFPVDVGYVTLIPDRLVWAQQNAILMGNAWTLFPSFGWLLLAAVVAISAAPRWATWLRSLSLMTVLAWVSLPLVVWLWRDLTWATDLTARCMYTYLIALLSYAIYFCVVPVLWPSAQAEAGQAMSMDVIAPAKGKTVKEILKGLHFSPRQFLFGKADKELVAHWGMVERALVALSQERKQRAWMIVAAMVGWPLLILLLGFVIGGGFERDVDNLWATTKTSDGQVVSTASARHAAERLFTSDLEFRGLTRDEALKLLHIEKMNPEYKLNVPPNSWTGDRMLLRISDGTQSAMLMVGINDAGKIVFSWLETDGGPINPFVKIPKKETPTPIADPAGPEQ